MPLFVFRCRDKAGALDVRLANRAAHLDYLRSLGAQLHLAGPLLDEAGQPAGSLVIIEAADLAAAQAIGAADPYAQAALFADVELAAFRKVLPD